MGTTTTLLAIWLGSNAAIVAAAHVHGRRRQRAHAGQLARHRARTSGPSRYRIAARSGLPFPLEHMERDWRYDDERRRIAHNRELRAVVGRLLAEDAALPCSCNGGSKYRHTRCTAGFPPHARPGQPMSAPYDWAAEPVSAGVHP